ncbi:MAG TPA: phosphoribosyltransferase [Bryobacteraceae bacterium]
MEIEPIFRDRAEAGKALAELVMQSVADANALVLALPRGGVPVGFQIAQALHADLDVFLVRKLGLPGQEELALGAIASGGVRVLNEDLIDELQFPGQLIDEITAREENELKRREELYRGGRPALAVHGRAVVLVDDGLATGASMKAAVAALRLQEPKRVIVAVPVAAREVFNEFRKQVAEIVCLHAPKHFTAVGVWYEDFAQVTDNDVQRLLGG